MAEDQNGELSDIMVIGIVASEFASVMVKRAASSYALGQLTTRS